MSVSAVAERSAAYALQVAMEPTLGASFDLMAMAPQGVAKLRELILSLAVRGKLLEQRADDASVNNVLHRIDAAKSRLITSGLIKASKPPREISFEGTPFDLPENWRWVTLAKLCATLTDGDHLPPPKANDGVPFLVIGDVRSGYVNLESASRFVTRSYFEGLDWSRRPMAGDILYTTVGSYGIPVPIVVDQEFCFQRHIALFRPALSELQGYLALALASPCVFEQATAGATGIAQKTVPLSAMRNFKIPLPPVSEQDRIVARVKELMGLCDALEAHGRLQGEQHARLVATLFDALVASAYADELAANWQRVAVHFDLLLDRPEAVDALEQTLLQLAVRGLLVPQDPNDEPAGELLDRIRCEKEQLVAAGKIRRNKALDPISDKNKPFTTPKEWTWVPFGDLVNVSSGITLGRKTTPANPVTLPYLRVANVQRWHVNIDHLKTITVDESELSRFLLQPGDLLLTEGGDWDKVGRTCIWKDGIEQCLHQNHVFKARGLVEEWLPLWAELFLNSTDARTYFAGASKQTTNLASINSTQLKNCPFPLPPLAEQRRIVARVEQLRALCADLRERLQQSRVTQSRLADALVTQAGQ